MSSTTIILVQRPSCQCIRNNKDQQPSVKQQHHHHHQRYTHKTSSYWTSSYKMSSYKTSIFQTSSYKTSRLQNVLITKRPCYQTSRLRNVQLPNVQLQNVHTSNYYKTSSFFLFSNTDNYDGFSPLKKICTVFNSLSPHGTRIPKIKFCQGTCQILARSLITKAPRFDLVHTFSTPQAPCTHI